MSSHGLQVFIKQALQLMPILVFVLFATAYRNDALFEGPDEIEHFRYASWIAEHGLPPSPDAQILGQFHQPPLYYMILAPLLWGQETDLSLIEERLNPFYPHEFGFLSNDNRSKYLLSEAIVNSPLADSFYRIRLVSIALGVGTLLLSYMTLKLLLSSVWKRFLVLSAIALHPQFTYISSVVNNDSLLIFLATCSFYGLVYVQHNGLNVKRSVFWGVILGCMLITKTSGFFFGLVVAVAILMNRQWWSYVPIITLTVACVAGGWYVRNLLVYDDLFLTKAWQVTWHDDVINESYNRIIIALDRAPYAYQSFWARFGSGAGSVSDGLYWLWDVTVFFAAVGLIFQTKQIKKLTRIQRKNVVLVGIFALVWIMALFYLAMMAWSGVQGRYLLPGILAWALMFCMGLLGLVPARWQHKTVVILVGLFFMMAIRSFYDFSKTYGYSPSYPPETTISYRYNDIAELIGITPQTSYVRPGDLLQITLHWRALNQTNRSLAVYLHALSYDGTSRSHLIGRNSYPGNGQFLSEDWRIGDEWTETYFIRVDYTTPTQTLYPLIAGLYDTDTGEIIDHFNDKGELVVLPFVGQVIVHGERIETAPNRTYRLGSKLALEEPELSFVVNNDDVTVEVCLSWYVLEDLDSDYHVFIHALDEKDNMLGQYDAPPRRGYYPTAFWTSYETIHDCLSFSLTHDDYQALDKFAVGLYDTSNGQRLPLYHHDERVTNDSLIISVR